MAVLANRSFIHTFPTREDVEALKTLAIFCGVGLAVSRSVLRPRFKSGVF
jgi:hypothetical protein